MSDLDLRVECSSMGCKILDIKIIFVVEICTSGKFGLRLNLLMDLTCPLYFYLIFGGDVDVCSLRSV